MPIPDVKIAHVTAFPGGRVRWEMDENGRHRIVVNESTSEVSKADEPGPWAAYVHASTWHDNETGESYIGLTEFYLGELPADVLNCARKVS